MRHARKRDSLGRAKDQQVALLRSLARQLITHGQIQTTLPKAKVLRSYVEKLITKGKKALATEDPGEKLHYIRLIGSKIGPEMPRVVLEKAEPLAERPGGYTRILKLPNTRRGDRTQMVLMQLLNN